MTFVFSYGSLMNPKARALTGITGESYPARVQGMVRRWDVPISGEARVSLGISPAANIVCNGVLIEVADDQLALFDAREPAYTRAVLAQEKLVVDGRQLSKEDRLWIYEPEQPISANTMEPIVQSYLDTAVAGCLHFGEAFAREFIESTIDWRLPWIDDRKKPRFPRTPKRLPHKRIDALLADTLGQTFHLRKKV